LVDLSSYLNKIKKNHFSWNIGNEY
jgi:hypothetical protein